MVEIVLFSKLLFRKIVTLSFSIGRRAASIKKGICPGGLWRNYLNADAELVAHDDVVGTARSAQSCDGRKVGCEGPDRIR